MKKISLITILSLLTVAAVQAQVTINWDGGGDNNLWSNALNWQNDNIPDNNGEKGRFTGGADVLINVDQNYTINGYIDGFGGEAVTHSLYGAGNLTFDVNSSSGTAIAVDNATGNGGGILRFNGKVTINNTGSAVTLIRNTNSSGNKVLFDTGSVLTIQTLARTNESASAPNSLIQMNGTFAASTAALQIGSNVSFGVGHDSTAFGQDITLLGGSKLALDGGSALSAGRKFQVNGSSELELNGVDANNGANLVLGGSNDLLLDVNANQANMGFIKLTNGTLTIDLDPSVTQLSFADSSAQTWGSGLIAIAGFQEGVIQFGDLTQAQLDAIDGGIYSLDGSGFLTAVPEPSTYALIAGIVTLGLIMVRRRRN